MTKFLGGIVISTLLAIYKTFAIYYLWSSLGVTVVGLPELKPIQIYILLLIYSAFSIRVSVSEMKAIEEDEDHVLKSRLLVFALSTMTFVTTFILKMIIL